MKLKERYDSKSHQRIQSRGHGSINRKHCTFSKQNKNPNCRCKIHEDHNLNHQIISYWKHRSRSKCNKNRGLKKPKTKYIFRKELETIIGRIIDSSDLFLNVQIGKLPIRSKASKTSKCWKNNNKSTACVQSNKKYDEKPKHPNKVIRENVFDISRSEINKNKHEHVRKKVKENTETITPIKFCNTVCSFLQDKTKKIPLLLIYERKVSSHINKTEIGKQRRRYYRQNCLVPHEIPEKDNIVNQNKKITYILAPKYCYENNITTSHQNPHNCNADQTFKGFGSKYNTQTYLKSLSELGVVENNVIEFNFSNPNFAIKRRSLEKSQSKNYGQKCSVNGFFKIHNKDKDMKSKVVIHEIRNIPKLNGTKKLISNNNNNKKPLRNLDKQILHVYNTSTCNQCETFSCYNSMSALRKLYHHCSGDHKNIQNKEIAVIFEAKRKGIHPILETDKHETNMKKYDVPIEYTVSNNTRLENIFKYESDLHSQKDPIRIKKNMKQNYNSKSHTKNITDSKNRSTDKTNFIKLCVQKFKSTLLGTKDKYSNNTKCFNETQEVHCRNQINTEFISHYEYDNNRSLTEHKYGYRSVMPYMLYYCMKGHSKNRKLYSVSKDYQKSGSSFKLDNRRKHKKSKPPACEVTRIRSSFTFSVEFPEKLYCFFKKIFSKRKKKDKAIGPKEKKRKYKFINKMRRKGPEGEPIPLPEFPSKESYETDGTYVTKSGRRLRTAQTDEIKEGKLLWIKTKGNSQTVKEEPHKTKKKFKKKTTATKDRETDARIKTKLNTKGTGDATEYQTVKTRGTRRPKIKTKATDQLTETIETEVIEEKINMAVKDKGKTKKEKREKKDKKSSKKRSVKASKRGSKKEPTSKERLQISSKERPITESEKYLKSPKRQKKKVIKVRKTIETEEVAVTSRKRRKSPEKMPKSNRKPGRQLRVVRSDDIDKGSQLFVKSRAFTRSEEQRRPSRYRGYTRSEVQRRPSRLYGETAPRRKSLQRSASQPSCKVTRVGSSFSCVMEMRGSCKKKKDQKERTKAVKTKQVYAKRKVKTDSKDTGDDMIEIKPYQSKPYLVDKKVQRTRKEKTIDKKVQRKQKEKIKVDKKVQKKRKEKTTARGTKETSLEKDKAVGARRKKTKTATKGTIGKEEPPKKMKERAVREKKLPRVKDKATLDEKVTEMSPSTTYKETTVEETTVTERTVKRRKPWQFKDKERTPKAEKKPKKKKEKIESPCKGCKVYRIGSSFSYSIELYIRCNKAQREESEKRTRMLQGGKAQSMDMLTPREREVLRKIRSEELLKKDHVIMVKSQGEFRPARIDEIENLKIPVCVNSRGKLRPASPEERMIMAKKMKITTAEEDLDDALFVKSQGKLRAAKPDEIKKGKKTLYKKSGGKIREVRTKKAKKMVTKTKKQEKERKVRAKEAKKTVTKSKKQEKYIPEGVILVQSKGELRPARKDEIHKGEKPLFVKSKGKLRQVRSEDMNRTELPENIVLVKSKGKLRPARQDEIKKGKRPLYIKSRGVLRQAKKQDLKKRKGTVTKSIKSSTSYPYSKTKTTKPISISKCLCTVQQYEKAIGAEPSRMKHKEVAAIGDIIPDNVILVKSKGKLRAASPDEIKAGKGLWIKSNGKLRRLKKKEVEVAETKRTTAGMPDGVLLVRSHGKLRPARADEIKKAEKGKIPVYVKSRGRLHQVSEQDVFYIARRQELPENVMLVKSRGQLRRARSEDIAKGVPMWVKSRGQIRHAKPGERISTKTCDSPILVKSRGQLRVARTGEVQKGAQPLYVQSNGVLREATTREKEKIIKQAGEPVGKVTKIGSSFSFNIESYKKKKPKREKIKKTKSEKIKKSKREKISPRKVKSDTVITSEKTKKSKREERYQRKSDTLTARKFAKRETKTREIYDVPEDVFLTKSKGKLRKARPTEIQNAAFGKGNIWIVCNGKLLQVTANDVLKDMADKGGAPENALLIMSDNRLRAAGHEEIKHSSVLWIQSKDKIRRAHKSEIHRSRKGIDKKVGVRDKTRKGTKGTKSDFKREKKTGSKKPPKTKGKKTKIESPSKTKSKKVSTKKEKKPKKEKPPKVKKEKTPKVKKEKKPKVKKEKKPKKAKKLKSKSTKSIKISRCHCQVDLHDKKTGGKKRKVKKSAKGTKVPTPESSSEEKLRLKDGKTYDHYDKDKKGRRLERKAGQDDVSLIKDGKHVKYYTDPHCKVPRISSTISFQLEVYVPKSCKTEEVRRSRSV